MISSMKRLIVGCVAMIGFAASANATFVPATWQDEIGGIHHVTPGSPYEYNHYLTNSGFRPLNDVITSFSLSIDIFDDARWDSFEIAEVDITGFTSGYVSSLSFGNDAFNGWSFLGLIELNVLGSLSVAVSSVCNWAACGDFNVGTSTLVANGLTRQVPEPGTIALLGLGLLGVGLGRRKLAK
jgi:hypothetical protein